MEDFLSMRVGVSGGIRMITSCYAPNKNTASACKFVLEDQGM